MPDRSGFQNLANKILTSVCRFILPSPAIPQHGQILLISLLVLVVAMTIGLSLAARTINNIKVTTAQDNSQRAFAAAEAGLERALTQISNTTITGDLNNNSEYWTTTNTRREDIFLVNLGDYVIKNDTADVWLSNYPDYSSPWSGTLNIYWGSSSTNICDGPEANNTMAAIEVVVIGGDRLSPTIDHYAFDPCPSRRSGSNNFSAAASGGTIKGKNFPYRASITVTSGLLARIIPLYAGTVVGIRGTNLPPQGIEVSSVGKSGATQRKITSFRSYPKAPVEFYPYLIFSPK